MWRDCIFYFKNYNITNNNFPLNRRQDNVDCKLKKKPVIENVDFSLKNLYEIYLIN